MRPRSSFWVALAVILGLCPALPAKVAFEIASSCMVGYQPSGFEGMIWLPSNAVEVAIVDDPAIDLIGEGTLDTIPGNLVEFTHDLVNLSDDPVQVQLHLTNQDNDHFDVVELQVFHDANGNARIDADEWTMIQRDVVPLKPRQKIRLSMRSRVPAHAQASNWATVALSAQEISSDLLMVRVNNVQVKERPDTVGLMIEKTVSRAEASVGETVDYTVRVQNVTEVALADAELRDFLPLGFNYLPGSLRVDDQPFPDLTAGSAFTLELGTIPAGQSVLVRYRTRIGPLALHGDGINYACASAIGFSSNEASAKVRVREEVFTSKGIVIGRVFVDANGNRLVDRDEIGVPGVRIYLEDGTYAITDRDGKYSFYGLSPRLHVAKLDATTLPIGAEPTVITTSQAESPATRFIDLKRGEMHKANFALTASSATREEIEARRASLPAGIELTRELKGRLTADGLPVASGDVRALPSSGVITTTGAVSVSTVADPLAPVVSAKLPTQTVSSAPESAPSLDSLIAGITENTLGFVNLKEGAILRSAQTDVLVKGPLGVRFELAVNGAIIGADQVGTKASLSDSQVEVWNFVGVNLNAGENRLRVSTIDPFGNPRGSATIHVKAPGALASLNVRTAEAIADGATPARVQVELLDAQGTPVAARTPLTLSASVGVWQAEDLDPTLPGTQVFVEGGHHDFLITPPIEPAQSAITVSSGALVSEETLVFAPNLRPLIAAGVVEGTLHLGTKGRGWLTAADARDAFSEELAALSAESSDGQLAAGGRAAFFLKGKVKGEFLLTASFDSDKADRERLFRDIQPGEYYPVYGDGSVRGYDAQSTGKLYVRIDHRRSYLLVGDFTTQANNVGTDALRSLGSYQRSLTGAKEHYETERVTANGWASEDSTRQFIGELPGNGTSGPYDFQLANAITNSERVEVLVRDRDQPSLILSTRTLVRFVDYEFEPFTGRLLLRAPIPSLDPNLNPVFLRITCEIEQGGEKFLVYGADAQVKLTRRLEVGAGYARDENPADAHELMSAAAKLQLAAQTAVIGEVAQSDSIKGAGQAERVDFTHRTTRSDMHAWAGRTDVNFRNPAALLLPGRIEAGLKGSYKLTSSLTLLSQALHTENVDTGGRRQGIRLDVERSWGAYKLLLGGRHSQETATPAQAGADALGDRTVNSARVKFTMPITFLPAATVFAEYERDVRASGRHMAATGFDYAFKRGGRAYGRHEFISSLGGPFEFNDQQRQRTTVVGLERDYMKDGRLFNEYREGNELYGREAEAALGLRNTWNVADGVRAHTSFERVTPVSGSDRNESTAITGAIDLARAATWRADARAEVRFSPTTDSLLNTLGYARQINRDFTFLAKSILLLTTMKGPEGGDLTQGRLQTGIAWRPTHLDRWNALAKYELKHEGDTRATASCSRRLTHLISNDVVYQPDANWTLSGRYAGKWVQERGAFVDGDYSAHLASSRVMRQLGRRWDLGLNLSVLADGRFEQMRYAVGPEVGFLVGKNLNIGVGYNVVGFKDRDLAVDGSLAKGAFFRMRLKFDEATLAGISGRRKG